VIQTTTAVENDLGDTGLDGPTADRLTDQALAASMFATRLERARELGVESRRRASVTAATSSMTWA
jgi:hypothetical protein